MAETKHDTYRTPTPVCPHCGHELDTEEMLACREDLFALAPDEGETELTCPACDAEFVVQGGYTPHYTTAFASELLNDDEEERYG